MECTGNSNTTHDDTVLTTAQNVGNALLTLPSMATTPDRAASKQQKKKQQRQQSQQITNTPKTSQKQRRASVSNTPMPRSRNIRIATTLNPQKLPQRPPTYKRSATESRTFDQIQAEHLYLLSNLQQQEARIRTLVAALATVQSQLQLPSTTAEARRLRKNAGFIKSKIADAEQQERLALLGIGHVSAELQSRYRHLQLHQHLYHQQQHIAHLYDHHDQLSQVQPPDTPYLLPQQGLACPPSERIFECNGTENNTGMPAIPTSSTKPWQERRSGGETEFMSPMSPLAPVFQPGASFFLGNKHTTASNGGIDHVVVDTIDNCDVTGEDATKQESLGGTTFASEAEVDGNLDNVDVVDDKAVGAKIVDFTPRPVSEDETCTKNDQKSKSGVGISGMHFIFDANGNDDTDVGDGASGDPDEFMPHEIRLRRGSHDGKHHHPHSQPLTSAREKRMSLPPVRFSWPEKE